MLSSAQLSSAELDCRMGVWKAEGDRAQDEPRRPQGMCVYAASEYIRILSSKAEAGSHSVAPSKMDEVSPGT